MVEHSTDNRATEDRYLYRLPNTKEHYMSKGSRPRPLNVTQREYDTRWDAIFGRDLKEVEEWFDQGRERARQFDEEARLEDEEFERIQRVNKSTTK